MSRPGTEQLQFKVGDLVKMSVYPDESSMNYVIGIVVAIHPAHYRPTKKLYVPIVEAKMFTSAFKVPIRRWQCDFEHAE